MQTDWDVLGSNGYQDVASLILVVLRRIKPAQISAGLLIEHVPIMRAAFCHCVSLVRGLLLSSAHRVFRT